MSRLHGLRTFGLTGGIGTGKSTVASLLREDHGIPVVDADQVARDVVAPGSDGLAAVVDAFGDEVLSPDGSLDRAAMRRRIMADTDARRTLEGITHPRIFIGVADALRELANDGVVLAGVEAALMVETGSHQLYDELVVVTATPETQVSRVVARDGVSESDAQAVLDAQLPLADKEAVADHVIRNDAGLKELAARVADVAKALRAGGA